MALVGAIDVGSNGIRLAIGRVEGGSRAVVLKSAREAVRLGQDTFRQGSISQETADRAASALKKFRDILEAHRVSRFRAVGTSAVREANNRDEFVARVQDVSGVLVHPISPEEEARLVYLAVMSRVDTSNAAAVLVDFGGGSVDISLVVDRELVASRNLHLGGVRLLQILQNHAMGEPHFNRLIRESLRAAREWIGRRTSRPIALCVGTGGNVECLGFLRKSMLGGRTESAVSASELDRIVGRLDGMPVSRRIRQLGLRPDRADVILPAAVVLQNLLRELELEQLRIPGVGLKEGLLIDLARSDAEGASAGRRQLVLSSAREIGLKYFFDEGHGERVARFAVQLFDETRPLHRLDGDARLLLEAAAILHDIGRYVSPFGHHKHSYYLVKAEAIPGLSPLERDLVANMVRYHRKSPPTMEHEPFRVLAPRRRAFVSKLAALLRVADALDSQMAGRVSSFAVQLKDKSVALRVRGDEDLLVEKWGLLQKADLFESIFKKKLTVEE